MYFLHDCESIEVPNEDGARITKFAPDGKMVKFLYEGVETYVDVIERGCKVSGDGNCLGWRSSSTMYSWISYTEFMKRASDFGSGMQKMGIKLGQSSIIGIYSQNCVEWLVAELGCFYYSSIIVPLYDTLGSDSCTFIINQCEIEAIVCDKEKKVKSILDKIKETPRLKYIISMSDVSETTKQIAVKKRIELHSFQHIEMLGRTHPVPKRLPTASDISEICYTSGTTGSPKGAVLTHENMVSAIGAVVLELGDKTPGKGDILISYLPLAHVFELAVELMILINGGCIGFFGGDVTSLLDDIRVLKPTFWPAVPRLLNKIYDEIHSQAGLRKINGCDEIKETKPKTDDFLDPSMCKKLSEKLGGRIRLVLVAAAPTAVDVLNFYRKALDCTVAEVFGQTELCGPCTATIINDNTIGSVGVPVACNMVKLEDVPELGYYKKDHKGEICVKGYNAIKCYYKDPERTDETFDENGWMHTGDIAVWLPNGVLKIFDRKKYIFKLSQGEYIVPQKLENLYLKSPYISQILVFGDSLKSFLIAIVVPDHNVIMSWCKENSNCKTWEEICKHPAVIQLIMNDMRRIAKSADLKSFEEVKKIHLHPHPLSLEEGHLTPTLKTKREICKKYFEDVIEALYSDKES